MSAEVYILKNEVLEVHISTLGATITRMIVPGSQGRRVDVVLGMERVEDYGTPAYTGGGAYLGAAIGRYANRIGGGTFSIDGQCYHLAINDGENHLHGGNCGFDKKKWSVRERKATVLSLHYDSPDGEENYPGNLAVDIRFEVKGKELQIHYRAVVDRKCYVNLTHHPYFNLNPDVSDIKDLQLKLYSRKYLKTNNLIPDGEMKTATGNMDFTDYRPLRGVIEQDGGLDDCFIFESAGKLVRQAELVSKESGIKMYVASDYPGLQVYTGRYLDVKNAKGGKHYGAYAGVALEAQYWPDSPNRPSFPSTLLEPGQTYCKTTIYGVE